MSRPGAGPGAPAAAAAVERFLQLGDRAEYLEMGWVFGTQNGAIAAEWPASEVERRMYALATVLRHDSYVIGNPQPVPGRVGRAERFMVTLHRGTEIRDVPFIVVMGPGNRWFVEQVDIEAITDA
jgi:hypothetical protein